MSLDLTTVEADVEEIVGALISAIPGNPALAVPIEKDILNKIIGFGVAYLQTKLATTKPTVASPAISVGVSAGIAAASSAVSLGK
jgi:hypothetical protein